MKQHITLDQIKPLSSIGKKNYASLQKTFGWFDAEMVWLNDKIYFLTIGQMIEFLINKREKPMPNGILRSIAEYDATEKGHYWKVWITTRYLKEPDCEAEELCDALWQMVKYILEKEGEK